MTWGRDLASSIGVCLCGAGLWVITSAGDYERVGELVWQGGPLLPGVIVQRQAALVVFLDDGGSLIADSESDVGRFRCRGCWFLFVLDFFSVLSTHAQENLAGRLI